MSRKFQWLKEVLGIKTRCQKRGHLWVRTLDKAHDYIYVCWRHGCDAVRDGCYNGIRGD